MPGLFESQSCAGGGPVWEKKRGEGVKACEMQVNSSASDARCFENRRIIGWGIASGGFVVIISATQSSSRSFSPRLLSLILGGLATTANHVNHPLVCVLQRLSELSENCLRRSGRSVFVERCSAYERELGARSG